MYTEGVSNESLDVIEQECHDGISTLARARFRRLFNEIEETGNLWALLPGTYYMDPPDGGEVTLFEQLRRMSEDAAKWREHSKGREGI